MRTRLRLRLAQALIALLALLPLLLEAAALRYRVQGATEDARLNIRAYLGLAPDDLPGAERFLQTAPTRASQALGALGYYDHEVTLSVDRTLSPWRVLLTVRQGEALRYTRVSAALAGDGSGAGVDEAGERSPRCAEAASGGGDAVLEQLLCERTPKPGDPLHHGRYEALKSSLQQLARQRGYFDAGFLENHVDIDLTAYTATLDLVFKPGPRYRFGAVSADESLLDPGLLERLLPFAPGDYYEQQKLLELRQRLLRLGYLASVVVLPDIPAREGDSIPLRIDLIAAPGHSYELGAGYSTDTEQRFSLSWRSPRLNRFGHSQETVLRWTPVNPQARVTYSIPLDDGANDVLQVVARLEDNEFGDLQSLQREFKLRRERTAGQHISAVHLRALDEQWGVFSDDFTAQFLLAGVSLSERQRSGNAVDPSAGLSQFYTAEVAGDAVGSDENLLRLLGNVTWVQRFAEHWRLVARAEAGYLWSSSGRPDELPPSLAFFAGGDNSLRGFAYQSVGREVVPALLANDNGPGTGEKRSLVVGGTRLLTGSLEMQRYFGKNWRGALFVDAGDAFVSSEFEANVGVGFGVHYLSPVGALRLEIANPVTRSGGSWRIHINIGAEF